MNKHENSLTSSVLAGLLLLVFLPASARAETPVAPLVGPEPPRVPRVLSAFGAPGGTLAVGASFFQQLPTADLRYVYGFGDRFGFDAQLATNGVIQWSRFGLRARLDREDESDTTAIAIRLSAFQAHRLIDEPQVGFGFGPSIIASFGDRNLTMTASLDAAIGVYDAGGVLGANTAFTAHPAFGAELSIARDLSLVLEAGGLITFFGDDVLAIPVISALIAW